MKLQFFTSNHCPNCNKVTIHGVNITKFTAAGLGNYLPTGATVCVSCRKPARVEMFSGLPDGIKVLVAI